MCFASEQAKRYKCTPIPTVDQPLWWKSLGTQQYDTSNKDIKDIVFSLGELHMEMSVLGAIGRLMRRTGLQGLLEIIMLIQQSVIL